MNLLPHIARFAQRLAEVEAALSAPDAFANAVRAQELAREHARLKEVVAAGRAYGRVLAELAENRALLAAEPAGSELAQLAADEVARLTDEESRLAREVQRGLLPPDPTDGRSTILEIRAGAGGAESALFAADLHRMYTRYAEARGWRVEPMDASPSDLGGFKEVIFGLHGPDAFQRLKFESGVHRVQRVPATEAQGRIHTSTATVAVLPEAAEVDVEIRPEELDISVCRAGGHGGQGVNTTDSAVRIVHRPTGLEVRCQDERSQLKNKAKALKVLRSRLLERRLADEKAKYDAQRSSQVGTGERSEKIRTYNFPQNRVTDHRIELTLYNLAGVMDGALDPVIEPLLQDDLQHRLKALDN
jgi:peptide chain release factor 1